MRAQSLQRRHTTRPRDAFGRTEGPSASHYDLHNLVRQYFLDGADVSDTSEEQITARGTSLTGTLYQPDDSPQPPNEILCGAPGRDHKRPLLGAGMDVAVPSESVADKISYTTSPPIEPAVRADTPSTEVQVTIPDRYGKCSCTMCISLGCGTCPHLACGFESRHDWSLMRHEHTAHRGEVHFSCRYPGCGRPFASKHTVYQSASYNRMVHERKHLEVTDPSGNTKYHCNVQNCSFSSQKWADLRRHCTAKHCTNPNVERYPCPALGCKYSGDNGFLRKDKLKSHYENIHKGNFVRNGAPRALQPRPAIQG